MGLRCGILTSYSINIHSQYVYQTGIMTVCGLIVKNPTQKRKKNYVKSTTAMKNITLKA